MIIDCISDLHGYYPKLDGGDLLIVAGDLAENDREISYVEFMDWFYAQPYERKILIAGNHDNFIAKFGFNMFENSTYLCDSGTEFKGVKIWGSPWTKSFFGMNRHCKAFTVGSDDELKEKWDLIPMDTNILVTHCPPWGILDRIPKENLGSISLANLVFDPKRMCILKLHVFGHIHEWGGQMVDAVKLNFVNASIMDENYDPVYKPVRIIYE
ncbi:MAG: metallophosphoesterase [Bacillota bacterium]|nr:metallophosphoesterase [Bacillota bacterium]